MTRPVAVTPLLADLGIVEGQRIVLLSFEHYDDWSDLRFARVDEGADRPIARRVPAADAWTVAVDGAVHEVVDAVGRGDRAFSNGEVRIRPALIPGTSTHITVQVTPDTAALGATVTA
jgi:hypothetical protein